MSLDAGKLLETMLATAKPALFEVSEDVGKKLTGGLSSLRDNIIQIETLTLEGKLTESKAKKLFRAQKAAVIGPILASVEEGKVAIEKAINGALDSIKDTVNAALPFSLF